MNSIVTDVLSVRFPVKAKLPQLGCQLSKKFSNFIDAQIHKRMKTLIVDDHKINYLLLKNLLVEHFPEIDEIDTVDSVKSALEMIKRNSYDILFLDMQLKDGHGFDILKVLPETVYIIVISSYENYALEAFKHSVVDYLVKPVNTSEFKKAVEKVLALHQKEKIIKRGQLPPVGISEDESGRLFVSKKSGEYSVVEKGDIVFIKAQGKYSEIHTAKGDYFVSVKNLKEFDGLFDDLLIRIHNSYLVNINYVSSYARKTSMLKLTNGIEIPVSSRKREELFKIFKVF